MRKLVLIALALESLAVPASASATVANRRCAPFTYVYPFRAISVHAYFGGFRAPRNVCVEWAYKPLRAWWRGDENAPHCRLALFGTTAYRLRCTQQAGGAVGSCHSGPDCEWLALTIRATVYSRHGQDRE